MEQDPDMPFLAIRKVALSWANDVDSEAPTETKIRVGVSSQEVATEMVEMTSIRRRRRILRYKSACLRKKSKLRW